MIPGSLNTMMMGVGIPQDYIALWLMAGDSTDETGSYDITLNGGAVQNSDYVDYDGVNDYGQSGRLAFNSNEFTIVMRVMFNAMDTTEGLWIANSRSASSGAAKEWQFYLSLNSLSYPKLTVIDSETGTNQEATWNFTPSLAVWYVFSLRFTGSDIEIYEGNSLVASTSFVGTMNTGSSHTQFAKRGWDTVAPRAYGNINQSRSIAYDRALSVSELTSVISLIDTGA